MGNNNVSVNFEEITPEIAADLIGRNISNNRPLKRAKISQFVRYMKKGLWDNFNGETIKISDTGFVIDGQNRLMAVVEAKVTCKFLVVRGLKESAITTIDMGSSRTVGDQLHFAGIPNSNVVAAAIQMYSNLKNGIYSAMGNGTLKGLDIGKKGGGGGVKYSLDSKAVKLHPNEIKDMYYARENDWYRFAGALRGKCVAIDSPSNVAGIWAYLHDFSREQAASFMTSLVLGEGLDSGSPVLTLRNRLLLARTSKVHYLTSKDRYIAYVVAWNAYRKGKKLNVINIKVNADLKPI